MSTVLVTNCHAEPGLGLAVALARAGHQVFATMPNIALSQPLETAAETAGAGMEVGPLVLDDDWSVDSCISHVVGAVGAIDVVIDTVVPSSDHTLAAVESLVATGLTGPLRLLRAVLPPMQTRGQGRVIFAGCGDGSDAQRALRVALASVVATVDTGPVVVESTDDPAPVV